MISINDVKCEELFNTDTQDFIKTKEIKEKWNSMSFDDRKFHEVPNEIKVTLYADEMLELIYSYIEDELEFNDGDIKEELWEETTKDFMGRFQVLLNEIAEMSTIYRSGSGEAIDPTIDLELEDEKINIEELYR